MTPSSAARLFALAALYAVQGMVYGFVSFVLVPHLSAAGVSLEAQTGVLALAGAPWILKLAWAPVLDARFGRGRPAAVARIATLAVAACVVAMAYVTIDPEAVGPLAMLWLLTNVALSLQDVATDAFALDAVAPQRRGIANAVMLGGSQVGYYAIGAMLLGAVVGARGLASGLELLAVATAVLGLATAVAGGGRQQAASTRIGWAAVVELLRRRASWVVGGVAALAVVADVLTGAMSGHFLVQRLHWSPTRIAAELPQLLLLGGVGGYTIAAWSVDRMGRASAAALGAAILAAVWVAFGLAEPWWATDGVLQATVLVQSVGTSFLYVGLHAWLMDETDPRLRATHFAVLMAILNLPRVVAPPLSTPALDALGWAGVFVAAGVYQAGMAAVLVGVGRRVRGTTTPAERRRS